MIRSTSSPLGGSPASETPKQSQDSGVDNEERKMSSSDNSKSFGKDMAMPKSDGDVAPHKMPPLCICPSCDKIMTSIKSLYGHHGRSHKTPMQHEKIKYICPICNDVGDEEYDVFETADALESHVAERHPGYTMFMSLTSATSKPPSKAKSSKSRRSSAASSTASLQLEEEETAERRRSTRVEEAPPKQQQKHPLCKCPECDKVFAPTGLFGHFGRVHSGQMGGHHAVFDWNAVSYACPFCPPGADELRTFRTFELAEAHVDSHHPSCQLVRPNSVGGSAKKSSSPPKPDVVSSAMPMRKSQRSTRRPADEDDNYDDNDDEMGPRKSQRSRRPVEMISPGEANHTSAVVRQKTTDEDDPNKPLFKCPACDKTNLSKHGLHAHYGMKHGGSVDMSKVKQVNLKPARKKSVGPAESRTGAWTDAEHEAFLEGVRRYGNRWKQISVEFVPTRDAKQIGSHALNYFTSEFKSYISCTIADQTHPHPIDEYCLLLRS